MHPNNKFIATTFLMGLVCVWAATTRCQARVLLDGQGSGLYAPEQDEVHWPVTRSDPIFWKYHGPGSEFSVIGYPLHSRASEAAYSFFLCIRPIPT